VEGELAVLGAKVNDGQLITPDYPDALTRVWSALNCETAGDVLCPPPRVMSSSTGVAPTTSLAAVTIAAPIRFAGRPAVVRNRTGFGPLVRQQWSLRDITPMVCQHFGAGRMRLSRCAAVAGQVPSSPAEQPAEPSG